MKPTLLVGLNDNLNHTELNTVELLFRNMGVEVGTIYGEVRAVPLRLDHNAIDSGHADVLLTGMYRPGMSRAKQQVYSFKTKMEQRRILSRVGRKNPNYYSQGAYPSFGQLPSNGRFVAKPSLGARSLCQLTFDTFDKTGATMHEIIAQVDSASRVWALAAGDPNKEGSWKDKLAEKAREGAFGTNWHLLSDKDYRYIGYLESQGIHLFVGHQHEDGEAMKHFGTHSLFIEDCVEDVEKEYRVICVGGEVILAYGRTLVAANGSGTRPMGTQENVKERRLRIEDLEQKFPGLEAWVSALHAEHQYPTWSLDLYKRKNGQWGAFEFSCEYSLSDLTSEDQMDIYSKLVANWLEMDNKD